MKCKSADPRGVAPAVSGRHSRRRRRARVRVHASMQRDRPPWPTRAALACPGFLAEGDAGRVTFDADTALCSHTDRLCPHRAFILATDFRKTRPFSRKRACWHIIVPWVHSSHYRHSSVSPSIVTSCPALAPFHQLAFRAGTLPGRRTIALTRSKPSRSSSHSQSSPSATFQSSSRLAQIIE
jgi:hypothetical protein